MGTTTAIFIKLPESDFRIAKSYLKSKPATRSFKPKVAGVWGNTNWHAIPPLKKSQVVKIPEFTQSHSF
ncbi:MAG: hypothetical protein A3A61_03605 [Candidatus Woykebacteria bacterium RIFCSPLOWO2_01_FULL_43_14]|uniref:Uncharacterized protein n=2 Tax=Candidatus Woykeibacteriota TaxID=1817899 RepID=A0A1G1WW53_9BACT|nr:MAG: hypothetical protein A3J50_04500 [Candidatus Woykebacteria bacterium RIFCSPHIGHO2_02_FULL_43_16b]OGY31811.1 MAG: hypothetical protein A3A61_03605 [Candidatus Woykebacteria bacterium RIFCSPLOWO2_01_FULL_43_14]